MVVNYCLMKASKIGLQKGSMSNHRQLLNTLVVRNFWTENLSSLDLRTPQKLESPYEPPIPHHLRHPVATRAYARCAHCPRNSCDDQHATLDGFVQLIRYFVTTRSVPSAS